MNELKMLLDYLIVPLLLYLAYLHKRNIDLDKKILSLQIHQKNIYNCCTTLDEMKKNIQKLLTYFELEQNKKG